MPDTNMEVLTRHRNTKNAPKLVNYAARKLPWPETTDLPDSNYYTSLDRKDLNK